MNDHFLFQAGEWLGQGVVKFTASCDVLHFRTRWLVGAGEGGLFHCTQTVEVTGGDRMVNNFEVIPHNGKNFDILFENEQLGSFLGNGLVQEGLVAWEFRHKGSFEGYEVYNKVSGNDYSMHAEYLSNDMSRTMVQGRIWKKGTPQTEEK